jgi:hypothetical protein
MQSDFVQDRSTMRAPALECRSSLHEEFFMSEASERVYSPKRDLHIGGLGMNSGSAPTLPYDSVDDDSGERIESNQWIERTRAALRDADHFVHTSPWAAVGIAAVLGVLGGLILAQRSGS